MQNVCLLNLPVNQSCRTGNQVLDLSPLRYWTWKQKFDQQVANEKLFVIS